MNTDEILANINVPAVLATLQPADRKKRVNVQHVIIFQFYAPLKFWKLWYDIQQFGLKLEKQ
jgi:hypothetical protein